jgi:hypothetical protein
MLNNCLSPSKHPSRPNTNHEDSDSLYLVKRDYPWLRIYGVINHETRNLVTLPNFVTRKGKFPQLNPVKMKSICLKHGLGANRGVNTLHLTYNKTVNVRVT